MFWPNTKAVYQGYQPDIKAFCTPYKLSPLEEIRDLSLSSNSRILQSRLSVKTVLQKVLDVRRVACSSGARGVVLCGTVVCGSGVWRAPGRAGQGVRKRWPGYFLLYCRNVWTRGSVRSGRRRCRCRRRQVGTSPRLDRLRVSGATTGVRSALRFAATSQKSAQLLCVERFRGDVMLTLWSVWGRNCIAYTPPKFNFDCLCD